LLCISIQYALEEDIVASTNSTGTGGQLYRAVHVHDCMAACDRHGLQAFFVFNLFISASMNPVSEFVL
jgi:hypothetical protein